MSDINLHRELIERGQTKFELARRVRAGDLSRLRRGAYADPLPAGAGPAGAHAALIAATLRQVSDEAVVSHASAAVVHGLPTWSDQLDRVHVTRNRAGGGRRETNLYVHGMPLAPGDTLVIGGTG